MATNTVQFCIVQSNPYTAFPLQILSLLIVSYANLTLVKSL